MQHYTRRALRPSALACAVRYLLIASLGGGVAAFAQSNAGSPAASVEGRSGPGAIKFNSAFVHGQNVDISRFFEGNPAPAGEFVIQVSVNNQSLGQHKVLFRMPPEGLSAQPCFTREELATLGIKITDNPVGAAVADDKNSDPQGGPRCAPIEKWVQGAVAYYQTGDFHLDLQVPQAYLVHRPRGYTDPNSWDAGVTAGILDYNANVYARNTSGGGGKGNSGSGNLGVTAGLNWYEWRLRKRFNTTWSSESSSHTQSQYFYLQRDVPALKSQLTLGDAATSGDLFDSLTVRGIQLQSDDRMLPDELRHYAPLVRGIAETNAKVQVTQRGQMLYETTVPPGAFELSDIGGMGYGGDLLVTVTEADGRKRTQVVPFSAPPMLLRKDVARFSVTVGKLQDKTLREAPGMAQAFYQRGVGNLFTLYGGGQLADHYSALGIGNAFNTPLGGVAVDITHARSRLDNGRSASGNSLNVSFSKHLQRTATDVTLAAYRYSSSGFYSLRDAAMARYGTRTDRSIVDYRARQRLTLNVAQPLWNGARLTLTGSFYTYWDKRAAVRQYTLSYNKTERYFSWSLALSRADNNDGNYADSVMASISVPLGNGSVTDKSLFNNLYSSVSRDSDGGVTAQASAYGSQGEQGELSYGIGSTVNKAKKRQTRSDFTGNVNYNTPFGQFGSTLALGNHTRQLSLSANGSVVAHGGGLTAGPRLGDQPFALVEAPGAKGAKLFNGYGARIDGNGFAIVPSLVAYRENRVGVETEGLPQTVDVLESESTVIPRTGAAVKVNVKTIVGAPVVLMVKDEKGQTPPIGTSIVNERGSSLGLVGQGGMAFIRGWQAAKENLYIKNSRNERLCTIYADAAIAQKILHSMGAISRVGVLCH
ncbi:fimbria/pilus outer membrane usher protein [Intestinirhabdus alba]|jgi:outer membrane usher protein|nr:fimbria/pilus outer membrane usher protein [Intestinirhabdus alba]